MGVGPSHQGYGPGAPSLEAEALLRYPPARWSGWGCSLSWLGKALGCCREAESWADLLFSTRDVPVSQLWPNFAGPYMPASSSSRAGIEHCSIQRGGLRTTRRADRTSLWWEQSTRLVCFDWGLPTSSQWWIWLDPRWRTKKLPAFGGWTRSRSGWAVCQCPNVVDEQQQ